MRIKPVKKLNIITPSGMSGVLAHESGYVYSYLPELEKTAQVSIGMPIRTQSYVQKRLFGIFEMNLPEGFIRYYITEKLRKQLKVNDMLFLALAGKNGIGSLCFEQSQWQQDPHSTESLKDILSHQNEDYFNYLLDEYLLKSCGISGVQPKVLVPERGTFKGSQLIVKKGSDEFKDIALNEFLCLSIAKQAGFKTPEFWLSNNQKLLVLRRFDRLQSGQTLAVEDMCVLMGKHNEHKYQGSYENLMKAAVLYHLDKRELFKRIALSLILGDGDAHLKNFAVTYSDAGEYRTLKWSPVYDVVCTRCYPLQDEPALKFMGRRMFPSMTELELFAKKHAIYDAKEVIKSIIEAADLVLNAYQDKQNEVYQALCQQIQTFKGK